MNWIAVIDILQDQEAVDVGRDCCDELDAFSGVAIGLYSATRFRSTRARERRMSRVTQTMATLATSIPIE